VSDDRPLLPFGRARRAAREAGRALPVVEVALVDAVGSVLAAPLTASTPLPPFDAAAMDGWAVSGPGPWEVTGHLLAGGTLERLPDGTAVHVGTGAALPLGADAVLRRERGVVLDSPRGRALYVGDPGNGETAPHPGYVEPVTDIRPRGQESAAGELLLEAGGVVTPAVAGMAAAAGYDVLPVVRPPDVAILVLGDELLQRGRPRDGRVRDALGPMLPGWVAWTGARAFPPIHVPDTLHDLLAELDDANADVVITPGSTAAGPADHLHAALDQLGATWVVDGVAVRPGTPMCLAALPDGRHVVGLPGNPLAAVSAVLTLVAPLVAALRGEPGADEERVEEALLDEAVTDHPDHVRLIPVHRQRGDLVTTATPTLFHGPAMLRGIALADGVAVIPPGGGARGSAVRVLPLP
jgi:molybdopterin molybdotransferase